MAAPTQVEVSISTTSQVIPTWPAPPTLPTITMNGNPFPQPQGIPNYPSGYQVVVIDGTKDMTDPANIVSNEYQELAPDGNMSWVETYPGMYDWMATQILSSGDVDQQRVFIVSFGMDANAPPTVLFYEMMLGLGAGAQLQHWETSVDTGSQSGDWVGFPANYILIGASDLGYGDGAEAFAFPGSSPVETTLAVTLGNPVPPSG